MRRIAEAVRHSSDGSRDQSDLRGRDAPARGGGKSHRNESRSSKDRRSISSGAGKLRRGDVHRRIVRARRLRARARLDEPGGQARRRDRARRGVRQGVALSTRRAAWMLRPTSTILNARCGRRSRRCARTGCRCGESSKLQQTTGIATTRCIGRPAWIGHSKIPAIPTQADSTTPPPCAATWSSIGRYLGWAIFVASQRPGLNIVHESRVRNLAKLLRLLYVNDEIELRNQSRWVQQAKLFF